MKCDKHNWEFHAELIDGTIVRWCNQCGGLQTYEKTCEDTKRVEGNTTWQTVLGLDQVAFTNNATTEIRLPESVKDDDGLYSEGLIKRDCQPEIRPFTTRGIRPNFEKPWTPDGQDEYVTEPPAIYVGVPCIDFSMEPEELVREYEAMSVLAGIKKHDEENCKGK